METLNLAALKIEELTNQEMINNHGGGNSRSNVYEGDSASFASNYAPVKLITDLTATTNKSRF